MLRRFKIAPQEAPEGQNRLKHYISKVQGWPRTGREHVPREANEVVFGSGGEDYRRGVLRLRTTEILWTVLQKTSALELWY